MFDAKSLNDGQRAILYTALFARKRSLQGKSNTGVSAFIMGAAYWLVSTFLDAESSIGQMPRVMEWITLAGAILSAFSMAVWLWIEHRAKRDLLRIGLSSDLVRELWALKQSDLNKVIGSERSRKSR